MKRKNRKLLLMFFLVSGLAWAAETDAEIVKDLDFFMTMDVVREDTLFDDSLSGEDFMSIATTSDPVSKGEK